MNVFRGISLALIATVLGLVILGPWPNRLGPPPAAAQTAATVKQVTAIGTRLDIAFTDSLAEGDANTPAATAFSVSAGGSTQQPSSVAVFNNSVVLTLGTALTSGQSATLIYTAPASGAKLTTFSGSAAVANFTNQAVTNNTGIVSGPAAPMACEAASLSNVFTSGAGTVDPSAWLDAVSATDTTITMTTKSSSLPVHFGQLAFKVCKPDINGNYALDRVGAFIGAGSDASGITRRATGLTVETDHWVYMEITYSLEDTALYHIRTAPALPAGCPVPDSGDVEPSDWFAATATGTAITTTVHSDAPDAVATAMDFQICKAGTGGTYASLTFATEATSANVKGIAKTASGLSGGRYWVRMHATSPGMAATKWQHVRTVDNTAPVFQSATSDYKRLIVTFNENLDLASAPTGTHFMVTGSVTGSNFGSGASVIISGATVTVVLSLPSQIGETLTLAYTKSATNPLRDISGNEAAAFSGKTVTNATALTPAAPNNVSVTGSGSVRITASWTRPGGVVTGYDVRYFQGAADPATEAEWIEEDESDGYRHRGTGTEAKIGGLTATTDYRVQVRAHNANGTTGPWSDSAGGATQQAPASNTAPRMVTLDTCTTDTRGNPLLVDRTLSAFSIGQAATFAEQVDGCTAPFDDPDGDDLLITWLFELPDNVFLIWDTPRSLNRGFLVSGAAALEPTRVVFQLTATDPHGLSVQARAAFTFGVPPSTVGAPAFGDRMFRTVEAEETVYLSHSYWYSVQGLPAGLSFDAATRTISGTPTESGGFTVTYQAEDADDVRTAEDTASLTFRMLVGTGIETVSARRSWWT